MKKLMLVMLTVIAIKSFGQKNFGRGRWAIPKSKITLIDSTFYFKGQDRINIGLGTSAPDSTMFINGYYLSSEKKDSVEFIWTSDVPDIIDINDKAVNYKVKVSKLVGQWIDKKRITGMWDLWYGRLSDGAIYFERFPRDLRKLTPNHKTPE